jgi:hypothetical protein
MQKIRTWLESLEQIFSLQPVQRTESNRLTLKVRSKWWAFDAPQAVAADIKAANIDIAIAQHPAEIGFYGVVTAYAHLTCQSAPPLIATGFTVIDKGNVDNQEIKCVRYCYLRAA